MSTTYKRRQKLTRRSYNRRLVLFGAMMLVAIALISTGFASWVISLGSTQNESGDIHVGVVADKTIKLTDLEGKIGDEANFIKVSGQTEAEQKISVNFHFEPEKGDTDGVFSNDGKVYENMTITVTGKLYNLDIVEGFAIKMSIPESVKKAAQDGYIVLPECVSENGYVVDSNTINSSNANASNISFTKDEENVDGVQVRYAIFSYDITFEWGNAFKLAASDLTGIETEGLLDVANYDVVRVGEQDVHVAKNPWIYYEEVMSKITKYEEQVKFAEVAGAKIDAFRKVIYGIDDAETSYDDVPAENKTFNITIIASTAALASDQQSQ